MYVLTVHCHCCCDVVCILLTWPFPSTVEVFISSHCLLYGIIIIFSYVVSIELQLSQRLSNLTKTSE